MCEIASQITSLPIAYLIDYSGADQRKRQGSASLAFVRGIHRWPMNSPHKGHVTWKMFQFDDVITGRLVVLYTHGQNLIHFFSELSHQYNSKYQDFVNSGMETSEFSKKLWNIACVSDLATVKWP